MMKSTDLSRDNAIKFSIIPIPINEYNNDELKKIMSTFVAIGSFVFTIAAHGGTFQTEKLVPNCFTKVLVKQPNPDVLLERGAF